MIENGEHLDKKAKAEKTVNGQFSDLYNERYVIKGDSQALVNAVRISPDHQLLATCTSTGLIHIYDYASGKHKLTLKGHNKGISDIVFSTVDSSIIASCSDDLTVRIWSIVKGACIRILKKHTYHVSALCFNSKGNLLVSGAADETVVIWDLTTGRSLKTLAAHSDPVSSVCLTPDDTIIISASYDGLMRLFDLESGQCLKTLVYNSSSHGTATASTNDVVNFPISNVQVTPNGKYILSTSLYGKIRLWDYMSNKVMKTYTSNDTLKSICEKYNCSSCFITATPEPLVSSGSDKAGVLFWSVQSKDIVYQLQAGETVLGIDSKDDGAELATCTLQGDVHVYDLNPNMKAVNGNGTAKSDMESSADPESEYSAEGEDPADGTEEPVPITRQVQKSEND